LDGNAITMIPADAFTSLTQLQFLFDLSLEFFDECRYVENNPLAVMSSTAFGQEFDGAFRFSVFSMHSLILQMSE
jgi:hypothetical protein